MFKCVNIIIMDLNYLLEEIISYSFQNFRKIYSQNIYVTTFESVHNSSFIHLNTRMSSQHQSPYIVVETTMCSSLHNDNQESMCVCVLCKFFFLSVSTHIRIIRTRELSNKQVYGGPELTGKLCFLFNTAKQLSFMRR